MRTNSISQQVFEYAAVAYEAHHYDDACNYLLDIINVCPDDWQARLCLSYIYLESKLPAKARHQSTFVAEHAPSGELRELARVQLRFAMRQEESDDTGVLPNQWSHLIPTRPS